MAQKKIADNEYLSFDDVLIRPAASSIEPADTDLRTECVRGVSLSTPVLSAAMDKVTETDMAVAMDQAGGIGVIHRSCEPETQAQMVKDAAQSASQVAAAVGVHDTDRAKQLVDAGAALLVLDSAHGHNKAVIDSARDLKSVCDVPLIVGNIATAEAVRDLRDVADAVKVGVGPGSICTTRGVTGVGVPQFSAIMEVAQEAGDLPVIADGGIRSSADMAKALAAGASTVMAGNQFAGTDEAPGEVVTIHGTQYKEYRGMGSRAVQQKGKSNDRYFAKGENTVPEGVEAYVPYKGSVTAIIDELTQGVAKAMGYIGAQTIAEMPARASFVRISAASCAESAPHSIYSTDY